MIYRRRVSPLHAVRAGVAVSYCLALALAALLASNPLELAAVTAAILGAGVAARVGRALRTALIVAIPMGIAIALVNALLTRDGLTVIARLGDLPLLGHTDVTLEATAYGGVLALRAVALILCGALYTAAVDPDEVLRLVRRVSFHSALTATVATRLVPVLVRDSRRLIDAQRCRPGAPPSRWTLARAVTAGALDRALDVAAALEVRGYGAARRPPRSSRAWSRHDHAFLVSATVVASVAVAARAAGLSPFHAYPSLSAPVDPSVLIESSVLIAAALLPFANRRGIA